jgi:membrane associated rhomboid family serine protease
MGIYDREYYRSEGPSFLGSVSESGKVCLWLIAINVGAFILQLVTMPQAGARFGGESAAVLSPVTEWCDLNTDAILHGQLWRLFTAAFLHGGFSHIFWNMLFLWWFGHEVENIYGGKEFLAFYLAAVLVSSLAYVGWQLVDSTRGAAIGASGAVSAVLVVFAMHYPRHRILLFMFIPVSIWLFVVFMVAKDLYTFMTERQPMVGVTAHLGGAAFGFLYYRQQWRVLNLTSFLPEFSSRGRTRSRPRLRVYRGDEGSETIAAPSAPPEPRIDEQLEAQLDAVLEKMARSGKESLTESEKELLLRASEIYKRRRT